MDINSNYIHFDNSCSFKNGILPDRNVSANAGSIFLQLTSIQSSHVRQKWSERYLIYIYRA